MVLGLSKDGMVSHHNFRDKYDLPFVLLSDTEKKVIKQFGVLNEKGGTIRSTFVIDENGKIIKEYRKVKVDGHAEEVLDFIREWKPS